MAETVQIGDTGHTAKVRHPVAVPALSVITLGIYYVYWWYQVNREVVDLGRDRDVTGLGDNPTLSLLAVFPGALVIVPPYVSLYNGVKRFQRAQQATIGCATLNGWIVLGLLVGGFIVPFATLIVPGYIQAELNKIWEPHPRPGIEPAQAPAAAADADLDRLKKLAELRDSGALSAEEFEAERRTCCTLQAAPMTRRPGSPDRTRRPQRPDASPRRSLAMHQVGVLALQKSDSCDLGVSSTGPG